MHRGPTLAIAAAVGVFGTVAYLNTRNTMSKPPFTSIGPLSLTRLKLLSSEQISHNTKKLRFALPDPNVRSGLSLTSALVSVSLPPGNGRWTPVFRPYTPTSDPNEPGFIEFMIKLYPNGKQSTFMHALQPRDSVPFMRIPSSLEWKPNQYAHVALIAGGAGITPMYQLLHGILANPEDKTRVTLVWGVNTDADLYLENEFAVLEKRYPGRFKTHYVVSHPVDEQYAKGYVTKELLESAGLGRNSKEPVKVMLCGPPSMEKALVAKGSGVLAELGYTSDQIHRF
ncbi:hypothetical protein C8F01DRAFT_623852 [Mycena amicta]|nr:hypothetical protein C8F01DRAFT_623852 [Mycena amicta]